LTRGKTAKLAMVMLGLPLFVGPDIGIGEWGHEIDQRLVHVVPTHDRHNVSSKAQQPQGLVG